MSRKLLIILILFISLSGIAFFKIKSTLSPCLHPSIFTIEPCLNLLSKLPVKSRFHIGTLRALDPHLNYLLGFEKPINYFVLLQNNTEIRANGGFTGSYAVFNVDKGDFTYRFQDIYVPDGQITNHITPPDAIQEAFKHGTWYTANFDYEP